jgi:hypothetical protein
MQTPTGPTESCFLALISVYIIIMQLVTGGELYCRKTEMARDTLKENLERAIHDNPVTVFGL